MTTKPIRALVLHYPMIQFLMNIYIFGRDYLQYGHSFPVRNDFSHAEQESQWDKKRHLPSHFKWFNLQHKGNRDLPQKRPILPSFEEGTEKRANDSLRDVFIQWMYTHTHTQHSSHKLKEICIHVLEGKKLIKRFKLQQKVKSILKRYSS